MKKNKIISLIIALVVVSLCFVGCGDKNNTGDEVNNNTTNSGEVVNQENNENEGKTEAEIASEKFQEISNNVSDEIKQYAGVVNTINMFFEDADANSYDEYGVSTLIAEKNGTQNPISILGYALTDLNSDGVEEFLIYDMTAKDDLKNVIVSLYTMRGDNEIYHILNSEANGRFELCENGVLRLINSEDESASRTSYYKVDQDLNLGFIEAIQTITNGGGTVTKTHIVGNEQDGTVITDEEEKNIESKYVLMNVTVNPVMK